MTSNYDASSHQCDVGDADAETMCRGNRHGAHVPRTSDNNVGAVSTQTALPKPEKFGSVNNSASAEGALHQGEANSVTAGKTEQSDTSHGDTPGRDKGGDDQAGTPMNQAGDPTSERSSIESASPDYEISMEAAVAQIAPKQSKSSLRRGKWTAEEEAYVAQVVQDFNSGYLDAPLGTTLRGYLSAKLQCDPMRITKKFTGNASIGKRVFRPAVRTEASAAAIDKAQGERDTLEHAFRLRLEANQKSTRKTDLGSTPARESTCNRKRRAPFVCDSGSVVEEAQKGSGSFTDQQPAQAAITNAAIWLDHASRFLGRESSNSEDGISKEERVQEVQSLIAQGRAVQQTTSALSRLVEQLSHSEDYIVHESPSKRACVEQSECSEDAAALVGFFRCVRASAHKEQA